MAGRCFLALVFLVGLLPLACTTTTTERVEPSAPKITLPPPSAPISFAYPTTDGQTLSTSSLAGRYSVIAFITTYDHFSQAQARFLSTVVNKHVPRINAGAIVLEPPENRILVEAFTKVVAPPYPVAMGDEAAIRGEGPFVDMREVPSIIILDPQGREVWRHKGLANKDVIDAALDAVKAAKAKP